MSAYQNFLDFFSMYNKERLDGISESYFTEMTAEERDMAFDFLLARVKSGGSEESVKGLFRANRARAVEPVKRMLTEGTLIGEAEISAAWNLYYIENDDSLLSIFVHFLGSPDPRLRAKAAYYVPPIFSDELISGLQGMIRTETEQLPRIHAVDKLLECSGISEETMDKNLYLRIFRDLHGEDLKKKEAVFKQLHRSN
ncbi:hypothetical protein RugamoR57_04590 [Duganella caerulea]|uniref:hypothetical protein n=1 Tax=Duganella caerulea TaxID=2885762 RepID=UPI0030EA3CFE